MSDPDAPVGPDVPDVPASGTAPAGWYAAETGFVRWWDGSRWGPPTPARLDRGLVPGAVPEREGATSAAAPAGRFDAADRTGGRGFAPVLLPHAVPGDNTKTLVILTHLGCVLGGFIMPLTVYLVEKRNPYVRHHAAEALNFQLTCLLVAVVSIPLMLVFVGFVTFLGAYVLSWVFGVMGAVKASQGQWWRYPLNLRLFVSP